MDEQSVRVRPCRDYAFHCIVTDVSTGQLSEMNDLVHEGVTSFKLFMAYPGVFMLDDGSIFKALQMTSQEWRHCVCMHAENGSAIDVIVQQALAEGKKAPKYHALTRPTTAEAEATARAIALAEMAGAPIYIVHMQLQRCPRESARGARSWTSRVRGDLPAVSLLVDRKLRCARIRRREVCIHSALAREMASGKAVERIEARPSPGCINGSLSILFQGAKRDGQVTISRRFRMEDRVSSIG